jgi:hypothetical protein
VDIKVAGTDTVHIDASGIGVNVTNPLYPFHTRAASGGDNAALFLEGPNNGYSSIYMGDTDDIDIGSIQYNHSSNFMLFQANNAEAMRIDSSGNIIIQATGGTLQTTTAGTSNFRAGVTAGNSIASGGNYNTLIGDEAGADITTGDNNTCVGTFSGRDLIATNGNTAVGSYSMYSMTHGDDNVAIGTSALDVDTKGSNSVAVGRNALGSQNFTSATDTHNTAVGYQAGYNITTGIQNTLIGSRAGNSATTPNASVIVGEQAAGGATLTGNDNTCVGFAAGYSLTSGQNNLFLGHDAGRSTSPSGTIVTGNNVVCLGDDNISSLHCADTSISSSDSRDKADITDFNVGLNWVKDLRPVTYKWDKRSWYGTDEEPYGTPDGSKKKSKVNIGFLAQEVLEVEKANGFGDSADTMLTCNLTEDGQRYGMKYERLVPVLVNAIKELSGKNDALEARIKKLEGS